MFVQSEESYLNDFYNKNNTDDLLESQKTAYENYKSNLSTLTDVSVGIQNA